ncbi:hypothetical protein N9B73_10040 [Verrucomicrobiales bacterium]|nr:hypothetical protein [Verrucomicrobiales bacterium]
MENRDESKLSIVGTACGEWAEGRMVGSEGAEEKLPCELDSIVNTGSESSSGV